MQAADWDRQRSLVLYVEFVKGADLPSTSSASASGLVAGDEAVISKAAHIVEELSKVQEALGQGYLSAFPREHLERLRRLESVWAPLYVVSRLHALA